MLWWPFNLLQSNKRTVPSVLALAKRDELELRAVSFVTDDLCSCRWAISVPFMLWLGGINDARLSAAFESLFAFKSTYWLFSLVCNMWSSFRQSEFLSVFWEVKFWGNEMISKWQVTWLIIKNGKFVLLIIQAAVQFVYKKNKFFVVKYDIDICTLNKVFFGHAIFHQRCGRCVVIMCTWAHSGRIVVTQWWSWFVGMCVHSLPIQIRIVWFGLTIG